MVSFVSVGWGPRSIPTPMWFLEVSCAFSFVPGINRVELDLTQPAMAVCFCPTSFVSSVNHDTLKLTPAYLS